jgi:hypothetical protein
MKFINRSDKRCYSDNSGYSEVIIGDAQGVKVILFHQMVSKTLQQFNLQPITPSYYPLAFQDHITELYKTLETMSVDRLDIQDIIFIIHLAEVESGAFHLSGGKQCILHKIRERRLQY